MSLKAFTDYPIKALGDESGKIAPVRPCRILDYDHNKYCKILVGGVEDWVKRSYIYKKEGRYGDVLPYSHDRLCREFPKDKGGLV